MPAGGQPAPGHTAVFDYFFNADAPIAAEDANAPSLTVNKVGQGNVITLSPPLVIAERDLDRAFDILDEAIGEVEASPGGERRAAPGSPAPSGGSAPDARRGEGN